MADFARAVERMPEWPSAAPCAAPAKCAPGPAPAAPHPVWGAARGGNAERAALLQLLLRAEAQRLAVWPNPKPYILEMPTHAPQWWAPKAPRAALLQLLLRAKAQRRAVWLNSKQ